MRFVAYPVAFHEIDRLVRLVREPAERCPGGPGARPANPNLLHPHAMTILYIILGVAVFVCVAAALAIVFFIRWIALGEPDVNGDPERDAGLPLPSLAPDPHTIHIDDRMDADAPIWGPTPPSEETRSANPKILI
jgi:hypothetical protein